MMSADEEVYILNCDDPRIAHQRFYWFFTCLFGEIECRTVKNIAEEYFSFDFDYDVPMSMDIANARSRALIIRPFSIAARQMFEYEARSNCDERIICILVLKSLSEGDPRDIRRVSLITHSHVIQPGCIILSMKMN
jgi:hypothetical protein